MARKSEIVKCGNDPVYFIKNYCKIAHQKRGIIPFELFEYQEETLDDFIKHRFNIILKARQMGLSTLCAAYAVWMILFHRGKEVLIVATKKEVAQNLIKKCKIIWQHLPKWLQFEAIARQTLSHIELANGSTVKAVPTNPDAGRSEALSLLIIDEAAIIRDFKEIYTSAFPTLATGGNMIVLSTPLGTGNLFHKLYTEARARQNEFNPIKIHWSLHPERDKKWFKSQTKNMTETEVAQEFQCDFTSSGETLCEKKTLDILKRRIKDPIDKWLSDRNLWIWEYPQPNHNYMITADVARGDKTDFSAFHIIDRETNIVVGEYQGKPPTDMLAIYLSKIGKKYNDALLIPESNSVGHSVIKDLEKLKYPNVYHRKNKRVFLTNYNPIDPRKQDYGFSTQGGIRDRMCQRLDHALRSGNLITYSSRLYHELETFVWKGRKYEAENGYNDDLTLGLAIAAVLIIDHQGETEMGLSEDEVILASFSIERNYADEVLVNDTPAPYMPIQFGRDPQSIKQFDKANRKEMDDFWWLFK